jgi:hypothetical protein
MKRLFTQIAVFGIVMGLLLVLAIPGGSAPLQGVQGSRIQAYFMSQDPDPADAGKDIDIRWQVFNTVPGTIDSLKFHLDAGYPFLFEAGDAPDIDLGPSTGTNDNKVFYVLHYKLRVADNAVKGTYNVTLNWNSGEGWVKKDFPINIDPKRADFVVGALVTSPEKLIADVKEAKLSVNIDNIGKGNAENVKVKLLLPEGFTPTFSYSDENSMGIIQKGGTSKADFFVDINEKIKEGEYIGKLEITYKDENDANNTYRTKTLDLAIPIKPAPDLIVESVSTTPVSLSAGSKAELRIKVKNAGNEKAESVSLRIFKDASQPFEFNEKSDFVGKLEPQDSGDAVLKMTVDANAVSKKYLLDVELRGIDEKNNVVIFRRTIPITVDPAAKGAPDVGVFGTLMSIFAAAALFYVKRRRV